VMLILGDVLGIVGLLLAPLVALAIQIVLNNLLDPEATTLPVTSTLPMASKVAPATTLPPVVLSSPATNVTNQAASPTTTLVPDFSTLLSRWESLRAQLKNGEEESSLRTNSLLNRLSRLISEAKEATASASSQ
jgi:hypothetical protein